MGVSWGEWLWTYEHSHRDSRAELVDPNLANFLLSAHEDEDEEQEAPPPAAVWQEGEMCGCQRRTCAEDHAINWLLSCLDFRVEAHDPIWKRLRWRERMDSSSDERRSILTSSSSS